MSRFRTAEFHEPVAPETLEAFGHWLEREVHVIASELVHHVP